MGISACRTIPPEGFILLSRHLKHEMHLLCLSPACIRNSSTVPYTTLPVSQYASTVATPLIYRFTVPVGRSCLVKCINYSPVQSSVQYGIERAGREQDNAIVIAFSVFSLAFAFDHRVPVLYSTVDAEYVDRWRDDGSDRRLRAEA